MRLYCILLRSLSFTDCVSGPALSSPDTKVLRKSLYAGVLCQTEKSRQSIIVNQGQPVDFVVLADGSIGQCLYIQYTAIYPTAPK